MALATITLGIYLGMIYLNISSVKSVADSETGLIKQSSSSVPTADKMIALTFDDGPNPATTGKVLEILKKHKVKATFFMLGSQAQKHPEMVKKVQESGHEIANHTFTHTNLQTASSATAKKEIVTTTQTLEDITGVKIKYVRPPYGASKKNQNFQGLKSVLWNVDSGDWQTRNKLAIEKQVQQTLLPKSVILMHDIYPETVDALENIIVHAKKEGFVFVDISTYKDIMKRN